MHILLANFTKMVNDSGGMAKVTCAFANEMVKRGHNVSLVYSDVISGDFYYKIDPNVECYDLSLQNGKRIKFPIHMKIKRELFRLFNNKASREVGRDFSKKYYPEYCKKILEQLKPDVIVSFNPGTSAVLICDLNIKIPIVTMSHGDPGDYFKCYPDDSVKAVEKSTVNQVLLPSFKEKINNVFPMSETVVIGNAIPQFAITADLEENKKAYKILFVGRLSKNHKRPHILIQAFGKIAKKFPEWQLELWGVKNPMLIIKS